MAGKSKNEFVIRINEFLKEINKSMNINSKLLLKFKSKMHHHKQYLNASTLLHVKYSLELLDVVQVILEKQKRYIWVRMASFIAIHNKALRPAIVLLCYPSMIRNLDEEISDVEASMRRKSKIKPKTAEKYLLLLKLCKDQWINLRRRYEVPKLGGG